MDLITQSKKTCGHFLLHLQTNGIVATVSVKFLLVDRESRRFESSVAHSTTDWTSDASITIT